MLSAYVLDSLTTWVSEFASNVLDLERANRIQCLIVVIAILTIYFLVIELKIIRILDDEYELIKKVYLNLVPENTLIN